MNTSQKKKVAFVTLGCKVNTYEAEAISARLEQSGFECVSGPQKADIYVLSTCAVTNEGERKSRGQIAKILKQNPNAEIYVCGCASEHDEKQFLKFPNVKYVVGTNNKLKIADIITGKLRPEGRSSNIPVNLACFFNDFVDAICFYSDSFRSCFVIYKRCI